MRIWTATANLPQDPPPVISSGPVQCVKTARFNENLDLLITFYSVAERPGLPLLGTVSVKECVGGGNYIRILSSGFGEDIRGKTYTEYARYLIDPNYIANADKKTWNKTSPLKLEIFSERDKVTPIDTVYLSADNRMSRDPNVFPLCISQGTPPPPPPAISEPPPGQVGVNYGVKGAPGDKGTWR